MFLLSLAGGLPVSCGNELECCPDIQDCGKAAGDYLTVDPQAHRCMFPTGAALRSAGVVRSQIANTHTWVTAHAEIGTPQSVLEAQAGHLSKRLSDHYKYKHISAKAARKGADELSRVQAEQRAEARARLQQEAEKTQQEAFLTTAAISSGNNSDLVQ